MMRLVGVAQALNVSVSTVRRLIAAGDLAAVRVGRQLRVPTAAVSDFLNTNRSDSNE
jgi:excisionase family DNA binding protein